MRHGDVCAGSEPEKRLRSWKPVAALRPFVERFAIREIALGSAYTYHPLPARKDCFLEFYLGDPFSVVNVASGAVHHAPSVVLVGPHATRREDIVHTGTLRVFHIAFTPTGFHALFQIPAHAIVNLAESAETVLGRSIGELEQKLACSPTEAWASTAEHFLLSSLVRSRTVRASSLTAELARSLLRHRGTLPVAELARQHGRSLRHVERLFEEQVGLSPKLFSRIARLQAALKLSQRESSPDWATVALDAGYFDQSHLVRDFRALTGETPAGFRRLQNGLAAAQSRSGVAFIQSPFTPNAYSELRNGQALSARP